jgi:hypothetical protein
MNQHSLDASREERSLLACFSLARGNGASMGKETVSANSGRAGEVVADEMFPSGQKRTCKGRA